MDDSRPVIALVLAAGMSTRFAGLKQLAEIDGKPALWHVLDAAASAGVEAIVVVVGHRADDVVSAVDDWRNAARASSLAGSRSTVVTITNPAHRDGQATSLQAGLRHAMARVDDDRQQQALAVVLLADQPGVSPDAIVTAVGAIGSHDVARANYVDGPSHPVVLARRAWGEIVESVSGDAGARTVFDDLDVVDVPLDTPTPADIDTSDDLGGAAADVRRWRAHQ